MSTPSILRRTPGTSYGRDPDAAAATVVAMTGAGLLVLPRTISVSGWSGSELLGGVAALLAAAVVFAALATFVTRLAGLLAAVASIAGVVLLFVPQVHPDALPAISFAVVGVLLIVAAALAVPAEIALVFLLAAVACALLVSGVMAVYTWKTPDAEAPLGLAVAVVCAVLFALALMVAGTKATRRFVGQGS